MIWLALLIPLVAIVILAKFYARQMNITEYAIVFIVPIICTVIGKYSSVYTQTHDIEYWNSYGNSAIYEEKWDEEVSCRHPKYETRTRTVRDSDGNTYTETYEEQVGYEHLYDVDNHPPRWTLYDNIGNSFGISSTFFEELCVLWNLREFQDMNRDYHSYDGDAYNTRYDNVFEHTIPICKTHAYENRIQCSKSVFNFQEVTPEEKAFYKLFDYPQENVFGFETILGGNSSTALLRLQKYNALAGARRQLHMMILVFKDSPIESAFYQEAYWKGGNKNEFILCIGTKGNDITWTKVISWTDEEELKIRIARQVKEMQKLDLVKVVDHIGFEVPKKFIRKSFADFSYITVRPTNRAILITFLVTLLVTVTISVISVMNGYDYDGNSYHGSRYRYR